MPRSAACSAARKRRCGGAGASSTFTVRKVSFGQGVERIFPVNSPKIAKIDVKRSGKVRRAKLYYLRDLRGKSARIIERTSGHGFDDEGPVGGNDEPKVETEAKKAAKAKAAAKKAKAEKAAQ